MMNSNLFLPFALVALLSLNAYHALSVVDTNSEEVGADNLINRTQIPGLEFDMEHHRINKGKSERLIISFQDELPDDDVILRKATDLLKYKEGDAVDKCIYQGYMTIESTVQVTVIGCPDSKDFTVEFDSSRSDYNIFEVKNGVVTPSIDDDDDDGPIDDEVVIESGIENDRSRRTESRSTDSRDSMPARFNGTIYIIMDPRFISYHQENATAVVNRIVTLSNGIFKSSDLVTSFHFKVIGSSTHHSNIETTLQGLDIVSELCKNMTHDPNVCMGMTIRQPWQRKGLAHIGGLCHPKTHRAAVAAYEDTDIKAARVFTHEIGHMLGMEHDRPRGKWYRNCALNAIYGIMDTAWYQYWSDCSIKDFKKFYFDWILQRSSFCMPSSGQVNVTGI